MGAGANRIQPKACACTTQALYARPVLKVTQVPALELVRGYHMPASEFHNLSLDNALFLGVTLCIAGC